jgi:dihydroorotase
MIGLEAAASVLQLVLINSGAGTWEDFARIASIKPAEIGALVDHGQIRVDKPANLTLIDPQASRRISSQSESLSRNNPWVDKELPGRVIHTVFNGKFTVKEGAIVD